VLARLRTDLRTLVISLVTALVFGGIPAMAAIYDANNAKAVDGLSAVKSNARLAARKGRLVATSPTTGKLPNNIIATAPNAAKLGGQLPSAFALAGHNHDAAYALVDHNHDGSYALVSHNHDGSYSPLGHTHDEYALTGHDHNSLYFTKTQLSDPGALNDPGNPVDWTKLKNVPDGLADGDQVGTGDITGVNAGAGLSGGGGSGSVTLSVDTSTIQSRVTGTCAAGSFTTGINADGSMTCASDNSDWNLTGNAGTTPASNFIGTTDNQPVVFKTGNTEALRLSPFADDPSAIFGGPLRVDDQPGGGLHTGTTGNWQGTTGWVPAIFNDPFGIWIEGGAFESGGFYADGDTAAIWSPGDGPTPSILRIYDEDQLSANLPSGGVPIFDFRSQGAGVFTIRQGSGTGMADGWVTHSSRRWKTDISTLDDPLSKIARLRGVSYTLKATGAREIGLVAEEVASVLPQVVTRDTEGRVSGVDYSRIVSVLIEGIKDQQSHIRNQRAALRATRERVASLENRLARIERALLRRR
jgi:Chaperone of endosialidase